MKYLVLAIIFISTGGISQINSEVRDKTDAEMKAWNKEFLSENTNKTEDRKKQQELQNKQYELDMKVSQLTKQATKIMSNNLIEYKKQLGLDVYKKGKTREDIKFAADFQNAWAGYVHNVEEYIKYFIYKNNGENIDQLKKWLKENSFSLKVWIPRCQSLKCSDSEGAKEYSIQHEDRTRIFKLYL